LADALLTIDCGNTTIACRDDAGALWSTETAAPDFATLRDFVGAGSAQSTCAVAVSVVPSALQAVREALRALRVDLRIAGEDLACPLELDYETVATLGADRWLGAFAAHGRFGSAVVVDCGTATTVDVVTADGVYRGGAIAPGPAAMAAGLRAAAPALPAADLQAPLRVPAKSTQASVDAGVLLGWVGLVERLVRDARAAAPDARLVVTGGAAAGLLAHTALELEHRPQLLHEGLRALAASP